MPRLSRAVLLLLARCVAFVAPIACCSTPPAKRVLFPAPRAGYENVIATSGHIVDEQRSRDIQLKTYSPAGAKGRLPLVVVSHGAGEDRDAHESLGRALARHGFFALHLAHDEPADRSRDIQFVLERFTTRPDIDAARIAIAGRALEAPASLHLKGNCAENATTAMMIVFLRGWLLGDAEARAFFEEPGSGAIEGVPFFIGRKTGTLHANMCTHGPCGRAGTGLPSTEWVLHIR